MEFSETLKYYRRESGLRQSDIARRLGVSQNAISSWETGRTEPSLGQLSELCKVLNCPIEALTNNRARKAGEITLNDVLTKIEDLNFVDLDKVETAIATRRERLVAVDKLIREKQQLLNQLHQLQAEIDQMKTDKGDNDANR